MPGRDHVLEGGLRIGRGSDGGDDLGAASHADTVLAATAASGEGSRSGQATSADHRRASMRPVRSPAVQLLLIRHALPVRLELLGGTGRSRALRGRRRAGRAARRVAGRRADRRALHQPAGASRPDRGARSRAVTGLEPTVVDGLAEWDRDVERLHPDRGAAGGRRRGLAAAVERAATTTWPSWGSIPMAFRDRVVTDDRRAGRRAQGRAHRGGVPRRRHQRLHRRRCSGSTGCCSSRPTTPASAGS